MREYETTFIVQPEISDEGCAELLGRLDDVLEREGANRLLHDDQGKRRLAYEIRKFQKGRYVTTYFLDEGKAVAPLERVLRLDESVLRFLTVQCSAAVADVDARKAEAAEEERIRAERARERAERDAEEERARQAAAAAAAAAAPPPPEPAAAPPPPEATAEPASGEAEASAETAPADAPAEAAASPAETPEAAEAPAEAPAETEPKTEETAG
ncbi:MAG: 30S ribosomal protein S6 [Deltaproteobacteria bacterium]|nr:30S ribosomal protein S6 [Deltaproteobacteria bacterium]MBW2394206.1 30S ribosomal protein S6 [Deltaproteobacteria bacterium]